MKKKQILIAALEEIANLKKNQPPLQTFRLIKSIAQTALEKVNYKPEPVKEPEVLAVGKMVRLKIGDRREGRIIAYIPPGTTIEPEQAKAWFPKLFSKGNDFEISRVISARNVPRFVLLCVHRQNPEERVFCVTLQHYVELL